MVKVIPKEEVREKDSPFVKVLFWFALLLLIASGALSYLSDWQLRTSQATLADVESKISQVGTKEQKEFKESIFNYKKKIDDVVLILKNHTAPTQLFQIIESSIHPNVVISDFAYRGFGQWKVTLTGQVTDLTSLAEQIVLFENNTNISKVVLSSVSGGKSAQILFKIELTLTSSALIMQ